MASPTPQAYGAGEQVRNHAGALLGPPAPRAPAASSGGGEGARARRSGPVAAGVRRLQFPGSAASSRFTLARPTLRRYALASLCAAALTIGLKATAYWLTGSVALLSDALESIVNLLAAGFALLALSIAARPADEDHAYGHNKVEYFSSGFEGGLILVAAGGIAYAAVRRIMDPQGIAQAGAGIAVASVAALINLVTARLLFRAGRTHRSIVLEADAQHLMTDVWTSAAMIGGVAVTSLTGWHLLDPLLALGLAAHVVRTGFRLVRGSALGLLDTALPEPIRAEIERLLDAYGGHGVRYHALRTRQAGRWRFVSFHVLVPGDWSVQRGHDLLERIEEDVRRAVPDCTVFTHLEPIEDPVSFADAQLVRGEPTE